VTGRSIALLAGLGLLVAACGEREQRVFVPRYLGEPNGDGAALIGALIVDPRNCLVVRQKDGTDTLIAVAATSSEWDDAGRAPTVGGSGWSPATTSCSAAAAIPLGRCTSAGRRLPMRVAPRAATRYGWRAIGRVSLRIPGTCGARRRCRPEGQHRRRRRRSLPGKHVERTAPATRSGREPPPTARAVLETPVPPPAGSAC